MNTLHEAAALILHDPITQLMVFFIAIALISITVNVRKKLKKK